MNRRKRIVIGIASLGLAAASGYAIRAAASGIPSTTALSYSGTLEDAAGPVNGSHNIQVILYDAATAGNNLCQSTPAALGITNGHFSVQFPDAAHRRRGCEPGRVGRRACRRQRYGAHEDWRRPLCGGSEPREARPREARTADRPDRCRGGIQLQRVLKDSPRRCRKSRGGRRGIRADTRSCRRKRPDHPFDGANARTLPRRQRSRPLARHGLGLRRLSHERVSKHVYRRIRGGRRTIQSRWHRFHLRMGRDGGGGDQHLHSECRFRTGVRQSAGVASAALLSEKIESNRRLAPSQTAPAGLHPIEKGGWR